VVVRVRLRVVFRPLFFFGAIFVRMNDRRVVVLVLVVRRAVLELTHAAALVVMRHVPVIVRVDLGFMTVFVLEIAHGRLMR
jgi:hypothetical protein